MALTTNRHEDGDGPARLFAVLWGVATLLHILWPPLFLPHPSFPPAPAWLVAALLLSAGAVILRPGSVWHLLLLAGVQVCDVVYHLPFVSNHWLLSGLVNATILGAAGLLALQGGRPAVQLTRLYETLTPSVRAAVIVFYFFTFFHKLNAGFMDPATSCAGLFFGHVLTLFSLPALPPLVCPVILTVLVIEGLLVLGLAVARWRWAACVLGLGFHLVLALDAFQFFYNFSAVMVALLWVCVPSATAQALVTRARPVRRRPRFQATRYHFLGAYAALVCLCWAFPARSWQVAAYGFTALWLAWMAALIVPARAGWRGRAEARGNRQQSGRPAVALLLLPVLVCVNGVSPYLGVKIRAAWQMYSNLNVDAAQSNHYLIPRSLDLGGFLADSVWITATSDAALDREYGRSGARITWFELRRYLAHRPDTFLMYVRAGQAPRMLDRTTPEPALRTPPPWLLRKLLLFRPLGPPAAALCDW